MEAVRNALFLACRAAALATFALGYGLALPWYSEIAVLACALCWLLAWRRLPGLCLGSSILVAALGVLLSAPTAPMILGAAASLGLWDFAGSIVPGASAEAVRKEAESYRRHRLPWLVLALALGASIALLGPVLSLRIPFFAMLACVVVCAIALDRAAARMRVGR
jgi:hypothetical protein